MTNLKRRGWKHGTRLFSSNLALIFHIKGMMTKAMKQFVTTQILAQTVCDTEIVVLFLQPVLHDAASVLENRAPVITLP